MTPENTSNTESAWLDAGAVADYESADRRVVRAADGREIAVFRVGAEFFAVANTCTHARAALSDGPLEGYEVECPLHGARFDIRTGRVVTPPASRPLRCYEVRVADGRVWVRG